MPTFIYIIGQKTLSGCPYLNTLTARKLLITRGKSKPARLYRTHTCKHFHLDIITSTEIKSLWRARALSIGLRGGGTQAALACDESLYLVLSPFVLCPPAPVLPAQGSPPRSALHLSLPQFYLFFIFSDHPLPASKCSLQATLPTSFLNLDLVSLSETCFSTKRFPSDTAEEKYVSIVCEALLCPDYHTDRWITHIPPLPSNKLPAEGPRPLHSFCAALKSHLSDSLDFPGREINGRTNSGFGGPREGKRGSLLFPPSEVQDFVCTMWFCDCCFRD